MREARQLTRDEVAQAYRNVFAGEDGALVLAHLQHQFGYTRGTTLEANDGITTAWREGQRYVLVHIGRMLEDVSLEENEKVEY